MLGVGRWMLSVGRYALAQLTRRGGRFIGLGHRPERLNREQKPAEEPGKKGNLSYHDPERAFPIVRQSKSRKRQTYE